jgi:hypothetical protein
VAPLSPTRTTPARPTTRPGSPTVSKNTKNPQGLSYSDKSNTAKGTNARIDSNSSVAASSTAGGAMAAVDDDKSMTTNDRRNDDTTANKKITKKKHKKVASNGVKTSINPPVDATHAAAVNSTTGVSGGDSAGSSGSGGICGLRRLERQLLEVSLRPTRPAGLLRRRFGSNPA